MKKYRPGDCGSVTISMTEMQYEVEYGNGMEITGIQREDGEEVT
ncbi:unnamed protein product, partial [marine sediment metagenome]